MVNVSKTQKASIPILIISLCLISVVAAVVLSIFASITDKPIKQAVINTTLSTFKKLQPDFNNQPISEVIIAKLKNGEWQIDSEDGANVSSAPNVVKFYPAKKDGKLVSVFVEGTAASGYAGPVTALAAISVDGAVENVDVTQSNETAGLGTNVYSRSIRKTIWGLLRNEYKNIGDKLNPNPVMDYFNGKMYVSNDNYTTRQKSNSNFIPDSRWKVEKDGGDLKYITGATITSRAVTDAVKKILEAYSQNKIELLKIFNC
jgi:Na+-translocating ferredoxin:NAD+ oxidoreductase subunit G